MTPTPTDGPPETEEPPDEDTPDEPDTPEIVVHKYEDENGNGVWDPGEKPMSDMRFEFVELFWGDDRLPVERVHVLRTDKDGIVSFRPYSSDLLVREYHESALYFMSTPHMRKSGSHHSYVLTPNGRQTWHVQGEVHVNVGNAQVKPPNTGGGGMAGTVRYQVVCGDTLWDIARIFLGSGERWTELYELNQTLIDDPDLIFPGQVFAIPLELPMSTSGHGHLMN